ncbi:MAG: alanine--tRNA ligase [Betaproteobacteria bacterium]|nr:alanine--tRNA ligase [Betaproteobacteria bacterium]
MNVSEIRQAFVDYFVSKGHTHVASSSLVPGDDPTLLFTNAGMNQFKDVFLGYEKRAYVRAVTSQRCVRAGGKHNDLENVGYTARHHTFFEMLGNFSFGDYFKPDAIQFAWELLTVVYKLPKEKLLVTVYADDQEAYDLWANDIGVPKDRIIRIGDNKGAKYASDNFWMMGDTGPCGPCSEIFYDHGAHIPGGPPGSPGEDGDRFIEIWNLVFMQYNREVKDGPMIPLPKPSVDTGMGLERLSAVLQHVHANYEIDLFQTLIKAAMRETGATDIASPSLRVIADHIRACAFLVCDGVIPENAGRGYVLRRIARRAMRHGYKLGQKKAFFYKLVDDLARVMGDAFPEIVTNKERVKAVLKQEEERFGETLEHGMQVLALAEPIGRRACDLVASEMGMRVVSWTEKDIGAPKLIGHALARGEKGHAVIIVVRRRPNASAGLDIQAHAASLISDAKHVAYSILILIADADTALPTEAELNAARVENNFPDNVLIFAKQESSLPLDGVTAFMLYDTYGFPIDLTADIGRERGFAVDMAGFEKAMAEQQERSRAAGKFAMKEKLSYEGATTDFRGYDVFDAVGKVLALYRDGSAVKELKAGEAGVVVLDQTPFYAESGGQVGDQGTLSTSTAQFDVQDTQKVQADVFGHHGMVRSGTLVVGDAVHAIVDKVLRVRTMRHHSATHLMHKALRQVLGEHVQQKGSLVDADKTRFDFAHNQPMTAAEIAQVEALVNEEVLSNAVTQARVMPIAEAQKTGAMMLFGEKYGDEVRVLDIGTSRELCGGTHVGRTGDIGLFKIVSEGGVAAGVRRVEAVAGSVAFDYVQNQEKQLMQSAALLKAQPQEVEARIAQVLDNVKALEKQLAQLKSKLAASAGDDLVNQAVDVAGVKLLAAKLEGVDAKGLRDTMDQLKNKLKSGVIVLAVVEGGKVQIAAGVTPDLIAKYKAGELVNHVAQQVGGKGGGKPDMAMAGGTNPAGLDGALASVKDWVAGK